MHRLLNGIAAAAAVILLCGTASAQTKTYTANLGSGFEVPPVAGSGKGTATVTLNPATKTITYDVEYSGLTGPATAAHIHGPAAAGANAGVMVPLDGNAPASPIKGTATLTDAQIADLEAGKTYVNVHTNTNKGGEIRGQLMPK